MNTAGFTCLRKHSLTWGSNTGLSSFWTFLELNKLRQNWDYYIYNLQSISIWQGYQHNGTKMSATDFSLLLLCLLVPSLFCISANSVTTTDLLQEELVPSRLFLSPPSSHSNIPPDVPPSFNSLFTTAFRLPHVNVKLSGHYHQLDFMMESNHFPWPHITFMVLLWQTGLLHLFHPWPHPHSLVSCALKEQSGKQAPRTTSDREHLSTTSSQLYFCLSFYINWRLYFIVNLRFLKDLLTQKHIPDVFQEKERIIYHSHIY